MIKLFSFLFSLVLSARAFANPACAVCTVAIGASLTIARKMGVKDEVVGVWAGAMFAILGYWLIRYFQKKNWNFPNRDNILMALSIASVGFLYFGELNYNPILFLGFLYIDSFLFATLCGAVVFISAMHFYEWMKAHHGGHAHFPFEKVVVPVLAVFILSLIFNYYPTFGCLGGF